MGRNREKSNVAIGILEKLTFLKGTNNIFADCIGCGVLNYGHSITNYIELLNAEVCHQKLKSPLFHAFR